MYLKYTEGDFDLIQKLFTSTLWSNIKKNRCGSRIGDFNELRKQLEITVLQIRLCYILPYTTHYKFYKIWKILNFVCSK